MTLINDERTGLVLSGKALMTFYFRRLAMKIYSLIVTAGAMLLSGTLWAAEPPMTFEALDTDGDGYISNTEAGAREDLTKGWQAIDKNTDNKLDITEFSAFESEGRFTPPEESEEPGIGAAPY
jgi:hypothetical protein